AHASVRRAGACSAGGVIRHKAARCLLFGPPFHSLACAGALRMAGPSEAASAALSQGARREGSWYAKVPIAMKGSSFNEGLSPSLHTLCEPHFRAPAIG